MIGLNHIRSVQAHAVFCPDYLEEEVDVGQVTYEVGHSLDDQLTAMYQGVGQLLHKI